MQPGRLLMSRSRSDSSITCIKTGGAMKSHTMISRMFSMRTLAVLVIASLAIGGCRSSRSTRSNARNRPAPAQEAAATNAPSAKSVLTHADSALSRVSQLSNENAQPSEQAPMAEPPGRPNFLPPRTPWGAPYVPQPNLTEYGLYEAALGAYNGRRYDEAIALFSQVVTTGRPP